jgi:hypothetical protein
MLHPFQTPRKTRTKLKTIRRKEIIKMRAKIYKSGIKKEPYKQSMKQKLFL